MFSLLRDTRKLQSVSFELNVVCKTHLCDWPSSSFHMMSHSCVRHSQWELGFITVYGHMRVHRPHALMKAHGPCSKTERGTWFQSEHFLSGM